MVILHISGSVFAVFQYFNESQNAHPGLTARVRAAELAMNGKETIVQAGDSTGEAVGVAFLLRFC